MSKARYHTRKTVSNRSVTHQLFVLFQMKGRSQHWIHVMLQGQPHPLQMIQRCLDQNCMAWSRVQLKSLALADDPGVIFWACFLFHHLVLLPIETRISSYYSHSKIDIHDLPCGNIHANPNISIEFCGTNKLDIITNPNTSSVAYSNTPNSCFSCPSGID